MACGRFLCMRMGEELTMTCKKILWEAEAFLIYLWIWITFIISKIGNYLNVLQEFLTHMLTWGEKNMKHLTKALQYEAAFRVPVPTFISFSHCYRKATNWSGLISHLFLPKLQKLAKLWSSHWPSAWVNGLAMLAILLAVWPIVASRLTFAIMGIFIVSACTWYGLPWCWMLDAGCWQ